VAQLSVNENFKEVVMEHKIIINIPTARDSG
jgi:hypothetical protein